jgi:hypothetical protein
VCYVFEFGSMYLNVAFCFRFRSGFNCTDFRVLCKYSTQLILCSHGGKRASACRSLEESSLPSSFLSTFVLTSFL